MNTLMKRYFWLSLWVSVLLLSSCAPKPQSSTTSVDNTTLYTSVVYTPAQVKTLLGPMASVAVLHSATYHQVNHSAIANLLIDYRQHLFADGVNTTANGWSPAFNCTSFTHYLLGFASTKYMIQNWSHLSGDDADKLAIFSFIYTPDASVVNHTLNGHDIVLILTEKGVEFWEPQPGGSGQVQLSANEKLRVREIED